MPLSLSEAKAYSSGVVKDTGQNSDELLAREIAAGAEASAWNRGGDRSSGRC
jgi:hypothetical protein